MKRFVCLLAALVLVFTLAGTAFAAEGGFVPSIDYKGGPQIVPPTDPDDPDNESYIGIVRDKDGNPLDYVDPGCLRITAVAEAMDEQTDVPQNIRDLLTGIFSDLNSGDMKLPFEKFNEGFNQNNMTVRDLFDARWLCQEHPEMIAPEGVVFEVIFDLGVEADEEIYVMTYDEAADTWSPIVSTVNNGDGTVTCTFEHLCAITFSVLTGPVTEEAQSGLWLWISLLVAAVAAVAGVIFGTRRKKFKAAA